MIVCPKTDLKSFSKSRGERPASGKTSRLCRIYVTSVPGAFAGKDAKPSVVPHYAAFTRGPVPLAHATRRDSAADRCASST